MRSHEQACLLEAAISWDTWRGDYLSRYLAFERERRPFYEAERRGAALEKELAAQGKFSLPFPEPQQWGFEPELSSFPSV